jgi:hypothetical protein
MRSVTDGWRVPNALESTAIIINLASDCVKLASKGTDLGVSRRNIDDQRHKGSQVDEQEDTKLS